MFDRYLVKKDSLQNVVECGKVTGFKFGVKIADYRGCFLSLHNGYYVEMDGVEYPREKQKFEINGKPPRSFDELKTCWWEHWDYDDFGYVYVEKEGGLAPGQHTLRLMQSVLAQYGYMPWDEEWLKTRLSPARAAAQARRRTFAPLIWNFSKEENGNGYEERRIPVQLSAGAVLRTDGLEGPGPRSPGGPPHRRD